MEWKWFISLLITYIRCLNDFNFKHSFMHVERIGRFAHKLHLNYRYEKSIEMQSNELSHAFVRLRNFIIGINVKISRLHSCRCCCCSSACICFHIHKHKRNTRLKVIILWAKDDRKLQWANDNSLIGICTKKHTKWEREYANDVDTRYDFKVFFYLLYRCYLWTVFTA